MNAATTATPSLVDAILDPLLDARLKGYPHAAPPRRRSAIGDAHWNVLAGDLPLPIALVRRDALVHNLDWMQRQARAWKIDLAPHGKTTMAPQLFRRQLDAGAWGMTFATVKQAAVGIAAGARRVLIANQVIGDEDLAGIQAQFAMHADLRIVFLIDSLAQLALLEAWWDAQMAEAAPAANANARPFEVMLELGFAGGRTGCRDHDEALTLAERVHASAALRLVGIECYEGGGIDGTSAHDAPFADALLARVEALARDCATRQWFECDEVLLSAGGSAVFDLVAQRLTPVLGRPVRGLLRSGCYVTHDHGSYKRFLKVVDERGLCTPGESLRPAIEVWALVQSRPEPGLAILAVGKRDISCDLEMPFPIKRAARDARTPSAVPAGWRIDALNDQHAYLRWDAADEASAPVVGERVGLGISHPCTTFDKWHWMPIVDQAYGVVDAVTMHF